jgi:hypothetical protein
MTTLSPAPDDGLSWRQDCEDVRMSQSVVKQGIGRQWRRSAGVLPLPQVRRLDQFDLSVGPADAARATELWC